MYKKTKKQSQLNFNSVQLSDTKANKPRMTLLHCVVMEAEQKHPQLLELPQDMETVLKCKNLSVEQIQSDITRLKNVISKLKDQVNYFWFNVGF